jgi:protein SCO1/2
MRRPSSALLALLILAFAAACGGKLATPEAPANVPAGDYEIRGTVMSVDAPRLLVELEHEAIPGVMPAMTMPYEVTDASVLAGVSAGDRVRGTLHVDARGFMITSLRKA